MAVQATEAEPQQQSRLTKPGLQPESGYLFVAWIIRGWVMLLLCGVCVARLPTARARRRPAQTAVTRPAMMYNDCLVSEVMKKYGRTIMKLKGNLRAT